MIDRHHLASHYRRQEIQREQARMVAKALLESPDRLHPRMLARSSESDRKRLRGIPAIGPSVAGHIPGTHPEQAAMQRRRGD